VQELVHQVAWWGLRAARRVQRGWLGARRGRRPGHHGRGGPWGARKGRGGRWHVLAWAWPPAWLDRPDRTDRRPLCRVPGVPGHARPGHARPVHARPGQARRRCRGR
jgi:hypothetical protein